MVKIYKKLAYIIQKIRFPYNKWIRLSPRDKAILELYYIEKKSHFEISKIYDVSRDRIRQIIYRKEDELASPSIISCSKINIKDINWGKFSNIIYKMCESEEIQTIDELLYYSVKELLEIPNFGPATVKYIDSKLLEFGLYLDSE